ncbi:hypothetical protein [Pseudomonas aeruginosa]|nr:hypothetical protein [Pseudomonas aeruginosa]MBW6124629.1 hypothetical protein [Pseudomonas aeruginosa]
MAPKQQIHDFIRLTATQHISAGSLEEHIATVDGQKIIHAFSLATGMAWLSKKASYSARFGELPDWLPMLHPMHRIGVCDIALKAGFRMPEAIDQATLNAYLSNLAGVQEPKLSLPLKNLPKPLKNASETPTAKTVLEFSEIWQHLLNDPHVRKEITKTYKERGPEILAIAASKNGYLLQDSDIDTFLLDLLHNDARLYKRYTAQGSYGSYHIDVRGIGGVYFYWAPDFGTTGYFLSVDDASEAILTNWPDSLVSRTGRNYRQPFRVSAQAMDDVQK